MSNERDYEEYASPSVTRASRKGERRASQRRQAQVAPQGARYGVWTGEGYLRAGESLEKKVAERSLKVEGQIGGKRRKKK